MRVRLIIAILVLSIIWSCHNQIAPEELDNFKANWYSKHLIAMDEPSSSNFKQRTLEAYRFIWLRTFHYPVVVRIEIKTDNSADLFLKVADGAGGYNPGNLKTEKAFRLSKKQIDQLRNQFKKSGFFRIKSTEESFGIDGAQWYIEANVNDNYHWVDRWSPEGTEMEKLGLYFLKLARYKPSTIY